jgi:hypothetical protein
MTQETLDAKTAFAMLLEASSRQFKVMQSLLRKDLSIVSNVGAAGMNADSADSAIIDALAKQFLFNAVRAYRICKSGANGLNISQAECETFQELLHPVVAVRNVNEHAFDPPRTGRGKESRPSMHFHDNGLGSLDETSLVIFGADTILMGPLNLVDVFAAIETMRATAGFAALD